VKKPDPRLFLLALENAQTRPEATVVVGDSWTLDVLGAQQAGIRSIWQPAALALREVKGHPHRQATGGDHVYTDAGTVGRIRDR
jgi:FMN phosphatase YigB (HAD superfamily)